MSRFRSPLNDIEHSKLYVDGLGWMVGYLPGAILRAPDGANNDQREK